MKTRLKLAAFPFFPALIIGTVMVAQTPRKPLAMEFVKIPPGEFTMGCSTSDIQCNADERPSHRVLITKAFEMGKYEVTQAQWTALMASNPSGNKNDSRPVENVSRFDALDFIAKLNAANDGYRYRLPTEAEWEYAARAGADSPASGPLDQVAWYAANSEDESHPVGQKRPNAWGLFDMLGNVREWTSDLYSETYYSVSPVSDPNGPQPCVAGAPNLGPGGGPGRGGPGPGGGPRGGGRGAPGGPQGSNQQPALFQRAAVQRGPTQQEQIDDLRRQVEQLQRQVQELRNQFLAGPPPPPPPPPPQRGGRGGPGGIQIGPYSCIGQGEINDGAVQLIDNLDGLPTGLFVLRGGGWDQADTFQRVSSRYAYFGPTLKLSDLGFRLVRQPLGTESGIARLQ